MASTSTHESHVGFIGLGAMGFGMASNLSNKSHYHVLGYDVYAPSAEKFVASGGSIASSPREVAAECRFLICMATNAQQVEDILFDAQSGALQALSANAVVLVCSTVNPEFYEALEARINEAGRQDVLVLDCPVSGGTKRAADGTLSIFASGNATALQAADQLLHDMSEKLYLIPGETGAASKVKMVNQLLVGTHIAAAAEAMAMAAKANLDTREVYNVILNAAGNSWAFENRVPHMLDGDWTPHSALDIFLKDMGIVVQNSRALEFPLPVASAVEQLYIAASTQGYGREDDAGLVRLFLPRTPNAVKDGALPSVRQQIFGHKEDKIGNIAVIGLGAMGQGMASSLLRAGYAVRGYDVYPPSVDKFLSTKGKATGAQSPSEAVTGAEIVVLMVHNASQIDDLLFGTGKVAESLIDGAIVILSTTVSPSFVRTLAGKLGDLKRSIQVIDAPVSGGVIRAANGTLTIICSGENKVVSEASGPLLAMTGSSANLCHIQGGVGAASSVKLINQLLAGVHIVAAAEAMAFASRLGLDLRSMFEILKNSAGWSWMLENRVPQMLDGDWTPHSALSIFVKDLGIVLEEARRLMCYTPVSSVAHTMYLAASAHGLSKEADAGVVRLWELISTISVKAT